MPQKLEKQVIPIRSANSPIKCTLEAYGPMVAMYSDAARNSIIRDAMWQGGEYYRTVFVPLKFTNYARKFGYHVTEQYAKRKRKLFGIDTPLVFSDEVTHNGMRTQILTKSRTEAAATKSKCWALIRMPGPAYMNATEAVYKTLRSALPAEVERVAGVIGDAMAENLEGTMSKRGGGNKPLGLSSSQESTFARSKTTKPRKPPGAGTRAA